jgi:phage major head subunit gpT-like protein
MPGKLLDRQKLEAAYVTYSTIFDMALANAAVVYPRIATVMNDVGPKTEFKWLGSVPTMQKWQGQRPMNRVRAETHSLETEWYANGIELDIDDIREDKLGVVRPRVEMLAKMGPRKIDAIVVDMYVQGFAAGAGLYGLTYDGQYLLDTDHTASASGGTSQSNLQAGALGETNWNQAREKMMAFVDDKGEKLELDPDTILAGPSNQLLVRKLLQQQFKANGESNVDLGTATGIINSRITNASWWAIDSKVDQKPVIVGIEFPVEFAELMGIDDLNVFMNRTCYAGAQMKAGFAYGHWQGVVGSTS